MVGKNLSLGQFKLTRVQFVSYSLHCSSSSSIVFGKCRNSSQRQIPNLSRASNEGGGSIRWKKIRTVTVDPFSLGRNGNSSIGNTISFYNCLFFINFGWSLCWRIRRIGGLCIMVTGVLAAVVRVGGVEDSLVVNASNRQWGPSSLHPPLSRQSRDLVESACCLCLSRLQVVNNTLFLE